ncbi:MAG: histone H1 [Ignavibacteria bacterium]|nr:histone H1 [Ignavibacteria bacterium]
MNRYQELLDLIQTFQKDFEKFYVKGNKSAGTRVRKHMAALKRKAQEIRNEIQEIKKKEKGEGGPEPGPVA